MEKEELISVIMSTYNEPESWIELSVNSILGQTYKNIELIIICDNPENIKLINQLNGFKKDERVKIIINKENIGLTKSLNNALKYARGRFIARMDSDDIAYEERLLKQIQYLKKNNLDLIGGGVICVDENNIEISKINNLPKSNEMVKKKIVKNSCVPHPTWFGKKEVFLNLEGYRDVDFAEDYDFLLRALAKGFKLGNLNEIVLRYRIRSGSISNSNGLKQFITSQKLIQLYNENNILNNINQIKKEIDKALLEINKEEEIDYYEASKMFTEGCIALKGLNLKYVFNIPKALLRSKYYRKKLSCYIKGLL